MEVGHQRWGWEVQGSHCLPKATELTQIKDSYTMHPGSDPHPVGLKSIQQAAAILT